MNKPDRPAPALADGWRTMRLTQAGYDAVTRLQRVVKRRGLSALPPAATANAANYERPGARAHVVEYAVLALLAELEPEAPAATPRKKGKP